MKYKLYAFSGILSVRDGTVRSMVGYTTSLNETDAKGKAYDMIKEKEPNMPILNIIVCFIPTEEFITCQCEKEYDFEEHF